MSLPLAFEIASLSFFANQDSSQDALIVFCDNEGNVANEIYKFIDKSLIDTIIKNTHKDEKRFSIYKSVIPLENPSTTVQFRNIILINIDKCDTFTDENWLELGGVCRRESKGFNNVTIASALPNVNFSQKALMHLFCGIKLRNYKFNKYKTNKNTSSSLTINFIAEDIDQTLKALDEAQNLADSVILARDLVNEPANSLGTIALIEEIKKLSDYGIDVEILEKESLEEYGLRALLGVAQGSIQPPYLAILRWNGKNQEEAPLALVGKGVVFDSGGLSLKNAAKMEDMKGDMGGAAAVIGAMRALAGRKAKVNVIGVIGIVENMPDGNAQRPGDIVETMSGQTVEVVNTDAEGRLVLADALWFTQKNFKPKLMIDVATLTGAVTIALGEHYAALYANESTILNALADAGQKTGENLWPMPLTNVYNHRLKSRFADMRNTAGREAGSIVAAQFLQHFVGDVPWAHLDIAATAFDTEKKYYNTSWATGFGVRLFNQFSSDFLENNA